MVIRKVAYDMLIREIADVIHLVMLTGVFPESHRPKLKSIEDIIFVGVVNKNGLCKQITVNNLSDKP